MTVRRFGSLPGLALNLIPVGVRPMECSARWRAACVLVVDPKSRPRISPVMVAAAMGLTAHESRVAAWFAKGFSVRDIVRATGRAEGSVCRTVRQIYRKQGITRHVELVRRLISIHRGYEPVD